MALVAFACCLVQTRALAQGRGAHGKRAQQVLIVRTSGDERVVKPLRAELAASELQVVELRPRDEAGSGKLSSIAAGYASGHAWPRALIRVHAEQAQVELGITVPASASSTPASNTLNVELVTLGAAPFDARLLAVRVAETLRARGLVATSAGTAGSSSAAGAVVPSGETEPSASGTPTTSPTPPPSAADGTGAASVDNTTATNAVPASPPDTSEQKPSQTTATTADRDAQLAQAQAARDAEAQRQRAADAARAAREAQAQRAAAQHHDDDDEAENTIEIQDPEAPHHPIALRERGLWLELAPAGLLSPGGLPPSLDVWLSARYQLDERWSIAGFALAPLLGREVERKPSSAEISTWLLGVSGELSLVRSAPWTWQLGIGAASVLSVMQGHAQTPLRSTHQTITTASAFGQSSLHLALSSDVALALRVLVGASVPRVTIRFVSTDVATWGQPYVLGTLGVEVALF